MAIDLRTWERTEVVYPESDGNPISDHTLQFRWIVTIKEGLDALFAARPDVFVAGDLLWYPVEGDNKTRIAPDILVVFGRPKGERGSYKQWEEEDIAPQVVFEILSPGNRAGEMVDKYIFYSRRGVEEYYLYDPFKNDLRAWIRSPGVARELLEPVAEPEGWVSPRLGIRFVLPEESELEIYRPDGKRFLTYVELAQAEREAEERAQAAQERADAAEERAGEAEKRASLLAGRLRELGIDPESI